MILTSDFCFMKRDLQPIELSHEGWFSHPTQHRAEWNLFPTIGLDFPYSEGILILLTHLFGQINLIETFSHLLL
jgi:hypothetical protein